MGARSIWLAGWVLMVVARAALAGAAAGPDAFTRVRGADATVHALIREGAARSTRFRLMLAEIQRSNAVVVIQYGLCAKGQVRSCVVHVGGNLRERHIRVVVNTRTTNDRLIATIAHEVQHALEIIRSPETTSAEQVRALYRQIGDEPCRDGRSERCETPAALEAEVMVLAELDRSPGR